jgi:hypothetical protein
MNTRRSLVIALTVLGLLSAARLVAEDAQPKPACQAAVNKQAAAGDITISWTLVDGTTRKPLSGVHVDILHGPKIVMGVNEPVSSPTVTDDSGRIEFRLSAAQFADSEFEIEIRAVHPGYMPLKERYAAGWSGPAAKHSRSTRFHFFTPQLMMFPAVEITGVVEDPAGKPLANISVDFQTGRDGYDPDTDSHYFFLPWARPILVADDDPNPPTTSDFDRPSQFNSYDSCEVVTGGDGSFRVNVRQGWSVWLDIGTSEYAPLFQSLGDRRGDLGTVRLDLGVRASGRVLDLQGAGVPGVWVVLARVAAEDSNDPHARRTYRTAQTDRAGVFQTEPLQPGRYVALVQSQDNGFETFDGQADDKLPAVFQPTFADLPVAGSGKPIEIRAVPHFTVSAQTVDSAGKPDASESLTVAGRWAGKPWFTSSSADDQGRIEVSAPRGLEDVKVTTNWYGLAVRTRHVKQGALQDQSVFDLGTLTGNVGGLVFVCYEAPVVRFRVVGADHQPIEAAKIQIAYANSASGDSKPELAADSYGWWESVALLPDKPFVLTVEMQGRQTRSYRFQLSENEEMQVEVEPWK